MNFDWLYGHTGFSFLDRWTVIHLAFWIFAGSLAWGFVHKASWGWERAVALGICLAVAYGWELLESYLAPQHPELWLNWFTSQGSRFLATCPQYAPGCHYESWWNSYLSDPLTCVVGVLFSWFLLDWGKP